MTCKRGQFRRPNLRELTAKGQLLPTDLVWIEGMKDWAEARKIKDLFPAGGASSTRIASPPTVQPPPIQPAMNIGQPAGRPTARTDNAGTGRAILRRNPSLTGWAYKIRVTAAGKYVGELPGSLIDLATGRQQELRIGLPPGEHPIELGGGGLRRSGTVQIMPNHDSCYIVSFSNLGTVGGGITLLEDKSPSPSPKGGSAKRYIILAAGGFSLAAVLAVFVVAAAIHGHVNSKSKRPAGQVADDPQLTGQQVDLSSERVFQSFLTDAETSVAVINEIPGLPQPTKGPHGEHILEEEETLTDDRLAKIKYSCFYEARDAEHNWLHGYLRSWYIGGRANAIEYYNNGLFVARVWWQKDGHTRSIVYRDFEGFYHDLTVKVRSDGSREYLVRSISDTPQTKKGYADIRWQRQDETIYYPRGGVWRVMRWRDGRGIDNYTLLENGSLDKRVNNVVNGQFFEGL